MGLFSFLKEAGKKIFKSRDEETQANPAIGEDQVRENQRQAMNNYLQSQGLNIADMDIQFDGNGKVTLTGTAATKADFEKASLIAGNIAGVSEVDNQMVISANEETGETNYHTVEKGDTLWAIATKFYNDGAKYTMIVEANQPMIKDADEIYPGQVLRIPALSA